MKPLLIALVLVLGLSAAPARISKGTPEARELWQKGQEAAKEKKHTEAAEFYRQAISADPDYVEAHRSYILERRRAMFAGPGADKSPEERDKLRKALTEELIGLYQGWIRQNPDRAVYHLVLGRLTEGSDSEKHYRKAVELEPRLGEAWEALSGIAEKNGDNPRSLEYAKKAVDSDPENPLLLRSYAFKFRASDPGRYRKLEMEVVNRWPGTEHAAAALHNVATSFANKKDGIPYLERLRASYPPEKSMPSLRGMGTLFRAYIDETPEKALELARDMVKRTTDADAKNWQENAAFAETFVEARNLVQARKFAEAKAALEKANPPRGIDQTSLNLMKAKATAGMGEMPKAYDELAKLVAEAPNETLEKHLRKLGARLNKTDRQVDDNLWKIRDASATAAKELNLPQYGEEDRKVKLADYHGRVVLVNFFFPG